MRKHIVALLLIAGCSALYSAHSREVVTYSGNDVSRNELIPKYAIKSAPEVVLVIKEENHIQVNAKAMASDPEPRIFGVAALHVEKSPMLSAGYTPECLAVARGPTSAAS